MCLSLSVMGISDSDLEHFPLQEVLQLSLGSREEQETIMFAIPAT